MQLIGEGLKRFAAETQLEFPPFRQRFPWLGADLQTVRNSFADLGEAPAKDGRLTVSIGGGGALSLAITKPTAMPDERGCALILVHGLGGCEDSAYMHLTARYFAAKGWTVYRMNYRGVGPSRETSLPPYSAGLTGDMRAALKTVADLPGTEHVFAMGFSLGGQLLMRTLGEGDVVEKLRAVVSVSAPLDLAASQRKLERPRNAAYVRYVVGNMRNDLEGVAHPSFTRDVGRIRSVLEFDEHIIAPYFGFENAADYYRCVSCKALLSKVAVPLLAIHAADDPWIPVEDYHSAQWPDREPAGALVLPHGGHVGFHGAGEKTAWYKRVAQLFFNQSLKF